MNRRSCPEEQAAPGKPKYRGKLYALSDQSAWEAGLTWGCGGQSHTKLGVLDDVQATALSSVDNAQVSKLSPAVPCPCLRASDRGMVILRSKGFRASTRLGETCEA